MLYLTVRVVPAGIENIFLPKIIYIGGLGVFIFLFYVRVHGSVTPNLCSGNFPQFMPFVR